MKVSVNGEHAQVLARLARSKSAIYDLSATFRGKKSSAKNTWQEIQSPAENAPPCLQVSMLVLIHISFGQSLAEL